MKRREFPCAIWPIDECDALSRGLRQEIRSGVGGLIRDFIDGYFWWRAHGTVRINTDESKARRVMLWGLDIVASGRPGKLSFYLLEVNVYPQLLPQAVPSCASAVARMLAEEYLPALMRV